jgi:hypothetical protein
MVVAPVTWHHMLLGAAVFEIIKLNLVEVTALLRVQRTKANKR